LEDLAEALARENGVPALGEACWRVIRFLREFYAYNGRGPLNRQISKDTGMSLLEMERLFPDGIKYGARRFAGLPNPKHCG
jgi:dissimilatory sulfite reductase related protein